MGHGTFGFGRRYGWMFCYPDVALTYLHLTQDMRGIELCEPSFVHPNGAHALGVQHRETSGFRWESYRAFED